MPDALLWGVLAAGGTIGVGFLFWMGARLVQVETSALFGRAMLSALFCGIVSAAVVAMVLLITDWASGKAVSPTTQSLAVLLVMIVCVVILRNGLDSTFRQAFGIWCCAVGMAVALAVALVPLAPLVEDFLAAQGYEGLAALR